MRRPVYDRLADRRDRAVHRCVDECAGRRADVEHCGPRAGSARELVPGSRALRVPRDLVPEACQQPFVDLPAERLEPEGTCRARVGADGGHPGPPGSGPGTEVAQRPPTEDGATIRRMAAPRGPAIQIPRWIQLVGLPVLLVVGYFLASTLGHALFLFLTAAVIAFLLNPLVRDLQKLKLRRGLAVAIVYLLFAAAGGGAGARLATGAAGPKRPASPEAGGAFTVQRAGSPARAEHRHSRL